MTNVWCFKLRINQKFVFDHVGVKLFSSKYDIARYCVYKNIEDYEVIRVKKYKNNKHLREAGVKRCVLI